VYIVFMPGLDPTPYLAHWRERARQDARQIDEAVARARAAVPQAVATLLAAGARRVWLIGSLARSSFGARSDLDFMTEGLGEREAWKAAGEAADRCGLGVDVLRAEDMDERWRRYHERFGELIHG
jgi:predicted nucleotidyltransferase